MRDNSLWTAPFKFQLVRRCIGLQTTTELPTMKVNVIMLGASLYTSLAWRYQASTGSPTLFCTWLTSFGALGLWIGALLTLVQSFSVKEPYSASWLERAGVSVEYWSSLGLMSSSTRHTSCRVDPQMLHWLFTKWWWHLSSRPQRPTLSQAVACKEHEILYNGDIRSFHSPIGDKRRWVCVGYCSWQQS